MKSSNPAHPPHSDKQGEQTALVVGAGIAGIQAAIDLADAGVQVWLLDKGDSIGGRMAQTDKTFPTLDCSSCTLTPRTVEAESHPNIRLLTRAELVGLERREIGYEATVRIRPRYVDQQTCVSCGRCAEACRLSGKVPREFDLGIGSGAAIGVPFPQAVPSTYAVDPRSCLMLRLGKCGTGPKCVEACEVNAIHLDEQERTERLLVGAVILATGYDLYRPDHGETGRPELGFGRYSEVLTNLQFERLCSASGPTAGKLLMGGHEPRRVVFIQCVGSRDQTTGAAYCSRVCCMVSLKQAVLALEKLPGAEVSILYMDIRAFGKGYEEFMERAQKMGVVLRRGTPSEIYRVGDALTIRFEDTLQGRSEQLEADLVVLAAGLRPRAEAGELSALAGVVLEKDGFFAAGHRDPTLSDVGGLFLAGTCAGPMDIPDAVASGSAAAGGALEHLLRRPGREKIP